VEEAGFELSVPPKTPGVLAGVGSRSRRLFLVAENQAETISGGSIGYLPWATATKSHVRYSPDPRERGLTGAVPDIGHQCDCDFLRAEIGGSQDI